MADPASKLRKMVSGKEIVVAPGVFSPVVAQVAQKAGFRAGYFSGAAFSNLLGLPDLGVTTLTEVAGAVRAISEVTEIPLIADVDTGFGEAVNVARTVKELRNAGAAAVQIEDQVLPKKCGHLEGKELVETEEMVKKLIAARQAAEGRILIIARTDARAVEGLGRAVKRAEAYSEAGADIIFPEALTSRREFVQFRRKTEGPLLANMTEFGKTPYMTVTDFQEMGYNIVIFPVTAFRAMMNAVKQTMRELLEKGTQKEMLDLLMTRDEVNRLVGYAKYERLDRRVNDSAKFMRKSGRERR